MKAKLFGLLAGLCGALAASPAAAATIVCNEAFATCQESVGMSPGNLPLAALDQWVPSTGSAQISLSNMVASSAISDPSQAVSSITFTLSNSVGPGFTTTADPTEFAIFNNTVTPTLVTGPAATGWIMNGTANGDTITLTAIGNGSASQMILPDGTTFPNADQSITSGALNPLVIGVPTFNIADSNITTATTISAVVIGFGANADFTAPETLIQAIPVVTPLPATLPLFASGLGALALLGWRRKKKTVALAA